VNAVVRPLQVELNVNLPQDLALQLQSDPSVSICARGHGSSPARRLGGALRRLAHVHRSRSRGAAQRPIPSGIEAVGGADDVVGAPRRHNNGGSELATWGMTGR
jgi:hypothetical protein